ncbi:Acetyl esterase/lipase [Parapedobacter composti]|uniref:Acetyl esterase/lipase n=2 Tax=Parapedobacter composti TaxID=623281 RepID=A0A1I1MDU1_9SPHI|nr:Acetyl esterase/lipase [Parapedobacter composti]
MAGQSQTDTSITYVHNPSPSFKSQFLQSLMTVLGKKNAIEKRIKANRFSLEAVEPPNILLSDFQTQVREINQRKVWMFKPKQGGSSKVILYIHGGGYISNLTKYDWRFVHELLAKTNCSIVVPDYPLAPVSNYKDVYAYFDKLYPELLSETSRENIIFMGNSCGGGIALGFAQKLRDENKPQPSQIILNSPWLDITMSNPEIVEIDRKDKLLGTKGLKMAGELYAVGLNPTDYRVSPIYGDFSGLGKISLFIGTHDLFHADSRKFKQKMEGRNISVNYFEYPKMFHVWIALTNLKESQHAINQIAILVNSKN